MSEDDKEGGIGPSLFSKIGDVLAPMLPMLLGLFAVFFAIKKFFPESTISKMLPNLPGFLGGEDKDEKKMGQDAQPETPEKSKPGPRDRSKQGGEKTGTTHGAGPLAKADLGALLKKTVDENGNNTLDVVERHRLKERIGTLKNADGSPISDWDLMKLHGAVQNNQEQLASLAEVDANGKLTNDSFNRIAKKAISLS